MTAQLTDIESFAEFRARRRREVVGRRGAVSFVWGDFVVEPDQRVQGAPGFWSPLTAEAGLRVRAEAGDGIRIDGEVVDGEATLYLDEADGPALAEFAGGGEGVIFTYDASKYALQVWNPLSDWASRFGDIAAYDEDPTWVVVVTVRPVAPGRTVTITHHRDPLPVEVPVVAEVEFEREGRSHRLVATGGGPFADRLIVHFRDATSGTESYGAGRSVWIAAAAVDAGHTLLDFNRAMLLPCSFSLAWNCPLPPVENTLTIPVRAGERQAVDLHGIPLL